MFLTLCKCLLQCWSKVHQMTMKPSSQVLAQLQSSLSFTDCSLKIECRCTASCSTVALSLSQTRQLPIRMTEPANGRWVPSCLSTSLPGSRLVASNLPVPVDIMMARHRVQCSVQSSSVRPRRSSCHDDHDFRAGSSPEAGPPDTDSTSRVRVTEGCQAAPAAGSLLSVRLGVRVLRLLVTAAWLAIVINTSIFTV
jgi:hypothetical protein